MGTTRVVLTADAVERAVQRLRELREGRTARQHRDQQPPQELIAKTGTAIKDWDGLERLLRSGMRRGARHLSGAIALAAHVLRCREQEITEEVAIGKPNLSNPLLEAQAVRPAEECVRCLNSTQDHRVLIVGELPRRGLHPVIFVQPEDKQGQWYSQEAPLVCGSAFAAVIYLGNPRWLGHAKRARRPTHYKIEVYALNEAWPHEDHGRKAFPEDRLRALLKGQAAFWAKSVERLPPALSSFQIRDRKRDIVVDWEEVPREFRVTAPATLAWKGSGAVRVEVRSTDESKADELVTPPRSFGATDPDTQVTIGIGREPEDSDDHNAIWVPKPGLYRVKLHTATKRRALLDPFELWLHVEQHVE